MNPMTYYLLAAVFFVLGLAAIGGATFGRRRNRRIVLAAAGVALWAITLLLYSQAASTSLTVPPDPTPVALATTTPAEPQPTVAPVEPTTVVTATVAPPALPGRIAFHSDRDGEIDIYVMNADGSEARRLTDAPGRDFEPHWSPDGSTIVFSTDRDDPENAHLYLMDADGANQRRLVTGLDDDQVGARWSPDGQYILFHSNPLIDGQPRFDIYRVRADGSELTNLSNTVGNNFMADWSPDGQRIVFVTQRHGNSELYVMNADGTGQVRLTESMAENFLPRWSPDGSQIVFESSRAGTTYSLYLIDAPDGAGPNMEHTVRQLTFPGFNSGTGNWAGADWILFGSDRDSTNIVNWEIYLMPADGSQIFRVTDSAGMDRFPNWTP